MFDVLYRWMTSYKLHLTDTIERMTKGQNIQGRMRGGGKSRGTPPPSNRSILKKPSIVSDLLLIQTKPYESGNDSGLMILCQHFWNIIDKLWIFLIVFFFIDMFNYLMKREREREVCFFVISTVNRKKKKHYTVYEMCLLLNN